MDISRRAQTFVWCIPVPEHTATHKLSALATKVVTAAGAVYAAGMDANGDFVVSCGHDPRRCCDDCCPAEEEGSNGHGGGCNKCSSAQGLVLPELGRVYWGFRWPSSSTPCSKKSRKWTTEKWPKRCDSCYTSREGTPARRPSRACSTSLRSDGRVKALERLDCEGNPGFFRVMTAFKQRGLSLYLVRR